MNLRNVDLNLLKVFEAILQEQSLSKAADLLCLSQPAASHALNRLREVVGDPLFVRRGNKMLPTSRAQELAQPIQEAMQLIKFGFSGISEFNYESEQRTFHIAMGDYSEVLILPKLLHWLNEHCAEIDLRIHPIPEQDAETLLATGRLDLIIDFYPLIDKQINRELLVQDHFVTVARAEHPLLTEELTLEEFLEFPHITQYPRQRLTYWIDEELAARGLKRRIALQTQTFLAIPQLLLQTDYLHTPPQKIANVYLQQYDLKMFNLPVRNFELNLYQYWHKNVEVDVAHSWLRSLVSELCQD